MKLTHKTCKPNRYMKQYRCVQLWYDQPNYWWDETINKWTLTPNWKLGNISNTFGKKCRSVKAFKRRLREWSSYLPEGTIFFLIGRYVGQEVIGKTKKYK